MNATDVIADFADAMRRRGLIPPPDLIADGQLHRCKAEGARHGKQDGAYILHLDGHPAGGFQNWKDGRPWETWHYANGATGLTPAERAAFDAKVAERRREQEDKQQRLAEAARRDAARRWEAAVRPDPKHPYLLRKGVRSHGLRQGGDELLVPRFDMVTGEIVNLQRILRNGKKLNLDDGRVHGTWHIIGTPGSTILVAEGFATAATGHEVTSHAAVVTFGSGNL